MLVNELHTYIFENKHHFLADQFERWVQSSRRFKTFAETYRDKIRRKHRLIENSERLKDLFLELETPYLLLQDPRFVVEYENSSGTKQRTPDFCITYRVNTRFNIEVTRISSDKKLMSGTNRTPLITVNKLVNTLCEKVGQMQANIVNVLVIGADGALFERDLLKAAIDLRARAERKEDAFFNGRGFPSAADFLQQYRRLSGVLLRDEHASLWVNSLAKPALSNELYNALRKVMQAEDH